MSGSSSCRLRNSGPLQRGIMMSRTIAQGRRGFVGAELVQAIERLEAVRRFGHPDPFQLEDQLDDLPGVAVVLDDHDVRGGGSTGHAVGATGGRDAAVGSTRLRGGGRRQERRQQAGLGQHRIRISESGSS